MNINPIMAILVLKNIVTLEEAEKIVEFVHDKPQSTILTEVINQVKELLPMQQPLTGGPEQQAEELAARQRVADEAKAADAEAAKTDAENANEDKAADEGKDTDSKQPKK